MGVKRMRYAGEGTEFESLREYMHGDDYRDIDWKATARRGRPIVRSFEAERSQTIVLAVDAGRLMMPRVTGLTKLDRAVNAALLLAYLGTERDDLVGLLVFGAYWSVKTWEMSITQAELPSHPAIWYLAPWDVIWPGKAPPKAGGESCKITFPPT